MLSHTVSLENVYSADSTTREPLRDKKRSRPPEEGSGTRQAKRSRVVPPSSSNGVNGGRGMVLQRLKMHRALAASSVSSSENLPQVRTI